MKPARYLFVAVVLLALSTYLAADHLRKAVAMPPPPPGGGGITAVRGVAVDAIGGKTVVVATATRTSSGVTSTGPVGSADGLTWSIVAGSATFSEDPETGNTLFVPGTDVPVVAVPSVGGVHGDPVTIGLNQSVIPTSEQNLLAAGGGSCNSSGSAGFSLASAIDVRAVVDASVVPLSQDERVFRFQHGEYFSYDPNMGPMRITYNPAYTSEVVLHSLHSGSGFFPASAETHLYLIIEALASGTKIFNSQPLVMRTASTPWPPFQQPMINDQPVSFYLVDNPSVEMMVINHQENYLYPTRELTINSHDVGIANGVLTASFDITNSTQTAGDVRWFVIGNTGAPQTPTEGVQTLAAGATTTVQFRTQASGSSLGQFITLGAVSQSGVRMSGARRVDFTYSTRPASSPGTPYEQTSFRGLHLASWLKALGIRARG